jgi:cytochrome bd-type quinol oxidase subunit 2
MSPVLPIVGVAYAAICVWLTVRIVNRREKWAKQTAAVVAFVPILYVLSFGPVCWATAAPNVVGNFDAPRLWMRVYFPIGAFIHYTRCENNKALRTWISFGAKRGGSVIVPTDASGKNWYGFTAE